VSQQPFRAPTGGGLCHRAYVRNRAILVGAGDNPLAGRLDCQSASNFDAGLASNIFASRSPPARFCDARTCSPTFSIRAPR
jgi:hypothetical protein